MAKRARSYFKNLNIKFKLILMLYVAVLPFLLLIIGILYTTMRNGTENTLSTAYQEVARQMNVGINFVMKETEDISSYLSINDSVKRSLSDEDNSMGLGAITKEDASLGFFMDMIATKSHLSFVSMYAIDGRGPDRIQSDSSVLKDDINEIVEADFYRHASMARGAPVWERFEKGDQNLFVVNKSDKIVMGRVIIDFMKNKNIGFLMLGINSRYFENICQNSISNAEEAVIVSADGHTLLEVGNIPVSVIEAIETGEIKRSIGNQESGKVNLDDTIIFYNCSDPNFSEIYYIIPNSLLVNGLRRAVFVSGVLLIGILLLLLPIAILISKTIADPLHKLGESMKEFKKGDFNQFVEHDSNDEIGEVAKGYNDMVKNIRELIDTTYILKLRERESELNALQAQINPHFLYNTLDSIYWKTLEDGNEDTSEMVYSLARIFRLSLNRGQGMTTVEKEVELVENYLNIQKRRFNEKLDYNIEVDNGIGQYIMPKLLLQPFVENAIVHGLEQEGARGFVSVKAACLEDRLLFSITDTGKGMSQEQIEKVFQIQGSDINTNAKPGGYAVSNVYERLKLRYKDDFDLIIESKENRGTSINISIPFNQFVHLE